MNVKTRTILLWIGRLLMAALFLMAGSQKIIGSTMMVNEFNTVGLGQWFRYFTGAMEISGALLLLWPRTSFFGALELLCVAVGAFCAQAFVLHGDVIHTIVIGAVLATLAWFQRPGRIGAGSAIA